MRAVTLSLALFFSGVALADAPDHNSPLPFKDAGTDLKSDPYSTDIGLTQGKMEKFTKVYVDASAFPATLKPIAPPPVPKPTSISPIAEGENGAGRTIKLVVSSKVPKGALTGENLSKALTEQKIGAVTFDGENTFTIVIGDEGLTKAFSFALGPVKGTWYRLQDLGELTILAEAPEEPVAEEPAPEKDPKATQNKVPKKDAASEEEAAPAEPTWEPLVVTAPPMPSAKGGQMLKVSNDRSAWADVKINGELAARISPYGNAVVHGLAPGVYELNFTVSSGYSWTREVATSAE